MVLKYLSTPDDPAWDCQAVRNTVDLIHVMNWIAEKVDLASVEAGELSDNDFFRQFSRTLRMSQAWLRAQWKAAPTAAEEQGSSTANDTVIGVDDNIEDPTQMGWVQSVEFGNDRWFEELFGWSSMG